MALTTMTSDNNLTLKKWASQSYMDVLKKTCFGRAASRGTIFTSDELSAKGRGDNVTFSFVGLLTGTGYTEGGTLSGNEEALDLQSDNMNINVVRMGVASPNDGTIEQQRTLIDFEDAARKQLPKWHMSRMDASFLNQLAGFNPTSTTIDGTSYVNTNNAMVRGLNSVAAPSTNRIIRGGGKATDQALTSGDTFTLDLIDAALELAQRNYPTIESLDGDEFDLYISHEQATDLKRDGSSTIQWYEIAKNRIAGGQTGDDWLTEGDSYGNQPVGKYANVNIIPTSRIAYGQNSSNDAAITTVRRAVLCGRNAAAFGSPSGGRISDKNVPLKYYVQMEDYDYVKGIEARIIYGLKKLQFESEDYGSIVISTYAGAHTS